MPKQIGKWRDVSLGEICEFKYGKSLPELSRMGGVFPVYGSNGIVGSHNRALCSGPAIVIGRKGSFGEVNFSAVPCWAIDTTYYIDQSSTSADLRWLSYRLSALGLKELNRAAAVPGLNREDAYRKRLLLPPLPEQRRIAAILDKADSLRATRREALGKLDSLAQEMFLEMFGDPRKSGLSGKISTQTRRLGELAKICTGKLDANAADEDGKYPFFTCAVEPLRINTAAYDCKAILVAGNGDLNVKYYEGKFNAYQRTYVIESADEEIALPKFLFGFLDIYVSELRKQAIGGVIKYIKLPYLTEAKVNLPDIEAQQEFARRLQLVQSIHDDLTHSQALLEGLFSVLQHRAFQGEL